MTFTLRSTYIPQDFEVIVAIENQCFPEGKRHPDWQLRNLFEVSDAIFFIAEHNTTIVGFIAAHMKNAPEGYIDTLNVAPLYSRKGVATQLLSAVESVLSGRHCKQIKLHVAVDNDAAIRLYEKSGYSKVGEEQDYYEDHTAALVLTKSL